MKLEDYKKIKIPNDPGVYFFYKGKQIIYIGKATSLKDRTKSYFGKDLIETRGPLLVDMVFHADRIDWVKTDSVLEALILEASLIKKYQPKYNTKEKDDKSFNYVVITREDLPRVVVVRGRDLVNKTENFSRSSLPKVRGGSHTDKNFPFSLTNTFGPFTNGAQLREALKIVRKIFPFLDEKSKNYLEFYRQINLAPDTKDHKMYLENIKNIKLFFQGKKKRIIQNLKKEMAHYAKAREFEKAGEIKRQIFALGHINDVSLLKHHHTFSSPYVGGGAEGGGGILRIEAYDIAHMAGFNMVGVMTVLENGEPIKSEYKKFKIRTQAGANDVGALTEVLERRLAHSEWSYPSLIVVDGGVAQINAARKVIKNLKIKIPIVSVLKDERHKPKALLGDEALAKAHKQAILLANSEAHRFAIAYHKNMRSKNFINSK